jgi:hypothetical protein
MYGHTTLAQTARYLHADECVLPDIMRQFEKKATNHGAVVVQPEAVEHNLLHHENDRRTDKSPVH